MELSSAAISNRSKLHSMITYSSIEAFLIIYLMISSFVNA